MKPLFSLCHTTARLPDGYQNAARVWFERCDYPENVEYILSVDAGPWRSTKPDTLSLPAFATHMIVINHGRKCAVDGWNATARAANGSILITVADDWTPCEHWDTEILRVLDSLPGAHEGQWVLNVDTGGDAEILTFSILTRAYFDRLTKEFGYNGGFFYDGTSDGKEAYTGMYADNEFTDLANRDGVIVDARHLKFPHDHPLYTGQEMDDVHKWQHRQEAFEIGERVYDRRRKELGLGPSLLTKFGRDLIAVLLPGSNYSACWNANFTQLFAYLIANYRVIPIWCQSSNVYAVRQQLASDALKIYPNPKFLLWIDSDNILRGDQFEKLMQDLTEHPELDAVAGWCWAGAPGQVSCGGFDAEGRVLRDSVEALFEGPAILRERSYIGFPVVLMRSAAIPKAGNYPFQPLLGDQFPYGFSGEEVAFCFRAIRQGARFAVDRRIKVPHLKLLPEETPAQESGAKKEVA